MQTSQHTRRTLGLAGVLMLALAVCHLSIASADSEPAQSSAQSTGDALPAQEQFAPKRQYFIAPRIGRSAGSPRATIWSSLEEASLMAPGQIQPNRGFPGPLRSSLLFLLGNRRSIGPRSASGLLPQARIGRRAAPSGLLPQPRVGRRSLGVGGVQFEDDEQEDGQQEVAVAALSDNAALNEAVESLMSG